MVRGEKRETRRSWRLFAAAFCEALKIAVKVAQEIKTFSNCNSWFFFLVVILSPLLQPHDLSIRMGKQRSVGKRSMNRSAQIWIRNYLSASLIRKKRASKTIGGRRPEEGSWNNKTIENAKSVLISHNYENFYCHLRWSLLYANLLRG